MNFQPLKDFLDYYLPMLGVPGSDTVIYKNHEEIFRYQSGFDSLRLRTAVRPDSIYNIYSCTRAATAIAVMQLVERGEILVTDPLYAFIPEFRNTEVAVRDVNGSLVGTKRADTPITIGHLLTMCSGINNNLGSESILKTVDETSGRAPTLDICRAIANEPLEFNPGESYFDGLSYDVLGGVIELVSGVRFADYMKDNIFLPLGMKDTAFHIESAKFSRLASQYDFDSQSCEARDISAHNCTSRLGSEYDSGGEGIVSTVDDYILLADALANGGVAKNGNRIISEYALRLMTTNMLNEAKLSVFSKNYNSGYGYGYGVRVNMNPAPFGNLAPVGDFGIDGKKLCYISCDCESRVSVFHAEHMGGLHNIVIPRLRNIIYACLGEIIGEEVGEDLVNEIFSKFCMGK